MQKDKTYGEQRGTAGVFETLDTCDTWYIEDHL